MLLTTTVHDKSRNVFYIVPVTIIFLKYVFGN